MGRYVYLAYAKTSTILGIEESHTPLSTTFTSKSLWRYCHVVYQQSLYIKRYSGSSTLCQEFRTGESTQESDRSQLFNGLEFPILNFNLSDFLATSILLSYCKIPFSIKGFSRSSKALVIIKCRWNATENCRPASGTRIEPYD